MGNVAPGVKTLCKLSTSRVKPINQGNLVTRRGLNHEAGELDLPIAIVLGLNLADGALRDLLDTWAHSRRADS